MENFNQTNKNTKQCKQKRSPTIELKQAKHKHKTTQKRKITKNRNRKQRIYSYIDKRLLFFKKKKKGGEKVKSIDS